MDSLCCAQQAADYCYSSATKIQELDAYNLCNESDQDVAGKTIKMRFKKIVDKKDTVEKAIVSKVPKNILRSTNWGMWIFLEWCEERSIETPATDICVKTNSAVTLHILFMS